MKFGLGTLAVLLEEDWAQCKMAFFFLAKRKFWNDLVSAPSLRAWEGRLEGAGLRGSV